MCSILDLGRINVLAQRFAPFTENVIICLRQGTGFLPQFCQCNGISPRDRLVGCNEFLFFLANPVCAVDGVQFSRQLGAVGPPRSSEALPRIGFSLVALTLMLSASKGMVKISRRR